MAAGYRFEGDPLTGQGTLYTSTGESYPGQLSDFFGGRFYISSGSLIDTQHIGTGGQIITTSLGFIGRQGPFAMAELEGGRLQLVSQIRGTDVNTPKTLGEQRTVRGQQVIMAPDGTQQTIDFGDTPVNKLGYQTIAVTTVDGGINLMQIRGQYRTTEELRADISRIASGADPMDYRLATSEETLRNAIAGGLLYADKDATGLLAKAIRDSREGGGQVSTDDITDLLLKDIDMGTIDVFSSTIFG